MIPLKALVAVVAVAAVAIPVSQARQSHRSERDTEVTVMTRNMFLGTDLKPIFNATSQPALFAAVAAGWAQVQSNDIPTRAKAMAREIASDKPELVGLQEAMLFQTDTPPDGPATPAGTTAYDFVGLLVAALADRGLEYEPVSVYAGTDAELPRACRRRRTCGCATASSCSSAATATASTSWRRRTRSRAATRPR